VTTSAAATASAFNFADYAKSFPVMFLKLGTEVGNSMSRLSLSCHVIYSTPCIRSFTQLAETIVFGWLGRAYCDRLLCSCRLPLLYLARSCVSSRAPPSMSHSIFNAVSPDHSIDPTPVIKFPSANNAKHIGSPYPPVQIAHGSPHSLRSPCS
jgi:hypothetical protein